MKNLPIRCRPVRFLMIVLVTAIVELKLKYKINRHIGAMSESIPWLSDGLAISRLNNILSIKGFACVTGSAFGLNSCWLHSAGRSSPALAGSDAPSPVDLQHDPRQSASGVAGHQASVKMSAKHKACADTVKAGWEAEIEGMKDASAT